MANSRSRALPGALLFLALMSIVHLLCICMRFKIPGKSLNVRLLERVETTDSQYDIFDIGVEQADGSIDSLVVGGSFSYAKSLIRAMDKQAEDENNTTPLAAVPAA